MDRDCDSFIPVLREMAETAVTKYTAYEAKVFGISMNAQKGNVDGERFISFVIVGVCHPEMVTNDLARTCSLILRELEKL